VGDTEDTGDLDSATRPPAAGREERKLTGERDGMRHEPVTQEYES
jgi:hypothetical protein